MQYTTQVLIIKTDSLALVGDAHLMQFWSVIRSPPVLETVIASESSYITRLGVS